MTHNAIQQNAHGLKPEVNKYLDNRLSQWARWYLREKIDKGLGFPDRAIEYNLKELGTIIQETPGPKPLPTNEQAEEIEAAVCTMSQQTSQTEKFAEAVRKFYLDSKENKHRAAKIIGVSEAQFYIYFNNGLSWLNGWFTGKHGPRYYVR